VEIVDVLEITPGAEASQKHLMKLVKECKEKDVRVIAVEPQYPQESSAKQLLQAVKEKNKDIDHVVIDPLETTEKQDLKEDEKELKSPDWYEKKMRENLQKLAKALP
jgi:ABC-type Zn uptake system ZnuABC Zn-binding protein ZnuA